MSLGSFLKQNDQYTHFNSMEKNIFTTKYLTTYPKKQKFLVIGLINYFSLALKCKNIWLLFIKSYHPKCLIEWSTFSLEEIIIYE